VKSNTDSEDPKRESPKTARELPSRKKVLRDKDDPRFTKSSTDKDDPSRANPKTARDEPKRA
jgi:hypothetical protein